MVVNTKTHKQRSLDLIHARYQKTFLQIHNPSYTSMSNNHTGGLLPVNGLDGLGLNMCL